MEIIFPDDEFENNEKYKKIKSDIDDNINDDNVNNSDSSDNDNNNNIENVIPFIGENKIDLKSFSNLNNNSNHQDEEHGGGDNVNYVENKLSTTLLENYKNNVINKNKNSIKHDNKLKIETKKDEKKNIYLPISTKIRNSITEKVKNAKWLIDVQNSYIELEKKEMFLTEFHSSNLLNGTHLGIQKDERCTVCTLRLGNNNIHKTLFFI